MNSIIQEKRFTLAVLRSCCLLLLGFLLSCAGTQPENNSPVEVLQIKDFRLLDHPQELVRWQHDYPNRTFNLPSYRTPQGIPLPGWGCQVIGTRRFFTNRSAKIYYKIEDLRQTTIFGGNTAAEKMRIWPVGAILVLETYSGRTANPMKESPLFVDCIRKFQVDVSHFPEDTLFAGEWSYQRFDVKGKVLQMVGGASACHQCHASAFRVTGDLVFTLFSE